MDKLRTKDTEWQRDFAVIAVDPAFQKSRDQFGKIAAARELGNWTYEEAAIVYHYSTDLEKIEQLNAQLREGRPDEHNRALRRLLDKALSKAPAHEGRVYRKIIIKGGLPAFLQRYRKGAVMPSRPRRIRLMISTPAKAI
ncbi:MAG: hypothetical protein ABSE73_26945 [Planctomycetota bacterium]